MGLEVTAPPRRKKPPVTLYVKPPENPCMLHGLNLSEQPVPRNKNGIIIGVSVSKPGRCDSFLSMHGALSQVNRYRLTNESHGPIPPEKRERERESRGPIASTGDVPTGIRMRARSAANDCYPCAYTVTREVRSIKWQSE
jgi:hypothetical protein